MAREGLDRQDCSDSSILVSVVGNGRYLDIIPRSDPQSNYYDDEDQKKGKDNLLVCDFHQSAIPSDNNIVILMLSGYV